MVGSSHFELADLVCREAKSTSSDTFRDSTDEWCANCSVVWRTDVTTRRCWVRSPASPKLGSACPHSRRVFFRPQKDTPGFFGGQKSLKLGSVCGHSRRGFFRPPKNTPGFFRRLNKLKTWKCVPPFPQGRFSGPKKHPWVFRRPKRTIFIENLAKLS